MVTQGYIEAKKESAGKMALSVLSDTLEWKLNSALGNKTGKTRISLLWLESVVGSLESHRDYCSIPLGKLWDVLQRKLDQGLRRGETFLSKHQLKRLTKYYNDHIAICEITSKH